MSEEKEFVLNETTKVIVSKKGRMTFFNFNKCVLQLMSSEVNNLKKAMEYIGEHNKDYELKTLKDLYNPKFTDNHLPDLDNFTEELKQEAIKWVNAFDNPEDNPELKKFHGNEEECWIKYFFNIRERDLNEKNRNK